MLRPYNFAATPHIISRMTFVRTPIACVRLFVHRLPDYPNQPNGLYGRNVMRPSFLTARRPHGPSALRTPHGLSALRTPHEPSA